MMMVKMASSSFSKAYPNKAMAMQMKMIRGDKKYIVDRFVF